MTPDDLSLIPIEEAADRLGTTPRHVRNLVASKRIPYVKVGRLVRFREADLHEWVKANTRPVQP